MTDRLVAANTDTRLLVPGVLGAATILTHIAWILVPDSWRDTLTIAGVALFFLTTATHALITRGPRWALAYLAVSLTFGWAVEAIGVNSGAIFGEYLYADRLGPKLAGVPIVIPMAWAMMAYPVWLAARRTVSARWSVIMFAAAMMTAWDIFLDPQMVDEGHWTWSDPEPALPGVAGIPAQNYAGWLVATLVLMTLIELLPRKWQRPCAPSVGLGHDPSGSVVQSCDDRVPAAMLIWVYTSNVMANALFWGRPSVALVGGLVMGVLVFFWLRSGVATASFWTRREPVDV